MSATSLPTISGIETANYYDFQSIAEAYDFSQMEVTNAIQQLRIVPAMMFARGRVSECFYVKDQAMHIQRWVIAQREKTVQKKSA